MLSPLSDDQWPPELDALRGGFTGRANVYRTMAHNPALLLAWQSLRSHVVTQGALPAKALEVVILRTGHRRGAAYERDHHIVRGRAAGLSDARIASIEAAPEAMTPADAQLSRAVDALVDANAIPNELSLEIAEEYGAQGLLDIIATVGFYTILAYIVKSFDTPLDDDIATELEARPLSV